MTDPSGAPYQFLAPYYERLSEARDWDAWIAYADAVLDWAGGGRGPMRILDAACGTGRIAVGLCSLGHHVTGVDVSDAMLAEARERAEGLGFALPLFRQDLRRLRLPERFDAAVCLCDSLNYLTEWEDFALALRRLGEHLEAGGLLLFDVNTEWKLANVYGDYTYAEHYDDFSYVWVNAYDPARRTVRMELTLFVQVAPGLYRRYDEVHVQRAYTHEEVVRAVAEAGLTLLAHGRPGGFPPPESEEERVFYLARKA